MTTENFDPEDRASWYFGALTREQAAEILKKEKEKGVFLVRDSSSKPGDYVLCVNEEGGTVKNYIVNRLSSVGEAKFKIGDQVFTDFSGLLKFYQLHYLDTVALSRPAHKEVELVKAKYDFPGKDSEDLPFKKDEILTVVSKDEQQWWTARNAQGQKGLIPVPYVCRYRPGEENDMSNRRSGGQRSSAGTGGSDEDRRSAGDRISSPSGKNITKRQLPAWARVTQARNPCAYDSTALKLEEGDYVSVTRRNMSGQWEGIVKGTSKHGHFPFTHVTFVDDPAELGDLGPPLHAINT